MPSEVGTRRSGIALADVVVAALDHLDRTAEVALVLILQELLRGEEIGVAAPPGQGHGDVTLADARRGLHHEDARVPWIVQRLGDGVTEPGEQTGLLGAGRAAGGEVGEQVVLDQVSPLTRDGTERFPG